MSKFYDWRERYGKVNEHNRLVPRDHWLEAWETRGDPRLPRRASARRLPPADVHDDRRRRRRRQPGHRLSRARRGRLLRPLEPHGNRQRHRLSAAARRPRALARRRQLRQHLRHVLLSRERPRRLQPVHRPLGTARINEGVRRRDRPATGPGKVPRRSAPHHHRQRPAVHRQGLQGVHPALRHDPRARPVPTIRSRNGKIERWHSTLKGDCLRPHVPLSLDDARQLVESFVEHYNHVRLHSAIGYVTPADKLAGREAAIFAERDRKLAAARERRAQQRQLAAAVNGLSPSTSGTEKRVEGAWGRGASSPPIPETSAAQPLHFNQHELNNQPPFNSLTPRSENSISR